MKLLQNLIRLAAIALLAMSVVAAAAQTVEPVGTASPIQTSVVTISANGILGSIGVLTQGASNLDFQFTSGGSCMVRTAYTAGQTCTVEYTFTPTHPGSRYGGITLTTNTGALLATSYIYGTGTSPQLSYSPFTQSLLGSGFNFPIAVAVDASGNIFVSDNRNNAVKEITAASGYITVNTLGSSFNAPWGLAVDGNGNVFVSDSGNNAVKEIMAAGGYTIVNTLGSGFNTPRGVAVDGNGNVFVSDGNNNAVKEITEASGYTAVTTLGSGLYNPSGLAVDPEGNVFVADNGNRIPNQGNNEVKEILATGGYTTVNTLLTGGNDLIGVALDGIGNLYVADFGNRTVQEILAAAGYTTTNTIGSGTGFAFVEGLGTDASGNVYVTLTHQNQVIKLDYADPPSLSFATTPVGSTSNDSPQTVTIANNGNASLAFSVPGSGYNPSITTGFTLGNGSTCPRMNSNSSATTLAAGASCTNLISFTPITAGTFNGTLITIDNNLNVAGATQTIPLNGTGTSTITGAVAAMPEPTTYGSSFTLITTVTPSSGTTAPTGTVNFSIDGTIVAPNVLLTPSGSSATASYAVTTSTYAVGTHSLTAAYSGDSNYSAATFTGTHTVTLDTTTSLLTLNVPPSTVFSPAPETVYYGQDFNAQGSVAVTGPGALTGTIDFYDGTSLICALPIVQTNCTTVNDNFDAGIHPMTASYTGDATNGPSTSPPAVLTILPDTTTTTLTGGTPNPQYVGLPVTFTAVSTGNYAPPTGTVDFYDSAAMLGSGALVPSTTNNSSTATFTTSTLGVGTHQINAGLAASLDFLGSSSTNYAQVILPNIVAVPSIVTLTSSLNPSLFGQTVSFTAAVTSTPALPQPPTGTLNFYDGSTLLGTSSVATGGLATFNIATLAVGTHIVSAQYSGDTYYAAQASNVIIQVVNPAYSGPADFNFTVTQNPFVVGVGLTTGVAVTVTPLNGWTADVALTCPASLPYGFTCTFAQTTITGGNGGTTLVLTTTAPHNCGAGNPPYFTGTAQLHLRMGATALAGLLLLILPRRRPVLKSLLLALICILPGVTGCAGTCTDLGTWPGTYSIPVTATGVGTPSTHTVNLQVQVNL